MLTPTASGVEHERRNRQTATQRDAHLFLVPLGHVGPDVLARRAELEQRRQNEELGAARTRAAGRVGRVADRQTQVETLERRQQPLRARQRRTERLLHPDTTHDTRRYAMRTVK